MVTEMAKGKSLDDAFKISRQNVADELEGLPPAKMHCSNLAEGALKRAIEDYRSKAGSKVKARKLAAKAAEKTRKKKKFSIYASAGYSRAPIKIERGFFYRKYKFFILFNFPNILGGKWGQDVYTTSHNVGYKTRYVCRIT